MGMSPQSVYCEHGECPKRGLNHGEGSVVSTTRGMWMREGSRNQGTEFYR